MLEIVVESGVVLIVDGVAVVVLVVDDIDEVEEAIDVLDAI